jgi:hypothetical protein
MSIRLEWDPAVVRPVSWTGGSMIAQAGGVVFSPRPGSLDAALLGARSEGWSGEGDFARLTFEAVAAGDPRLRVASVQARDATNREVPVERSFLPLTKLPGRTALSAAAPNPFSAATSFTLSIARTARIEVDLYSPTGRHVRTLVREERAPGEYHLSWDGRDDDGRDVPSGAYFLRMAAGGRIVTRASLVRLR